MLGANVLTDLKVTNEEITEEKIMLFSSIITVTGAINARYPNASFREDACNYYISRIRKIMDEADFEQSVYGKLIDFMESGNVSRLDNTDLLDSIEELLLAFEECYVSRIEEYINLEGYFTRLLKYNALTSKFDVSSPEEHEPFIDAEEKKKILGFLSTLK